MSMLQCVSAKAIVIDPRTAKALILRLNKTERLQKGRDEWHLPGGVRDDPAEPLTQTAQREVREETGIANTKVVDKVDEAEWDAFYEGEPAHFQATFYELEVIGEVPSIRLSEEHDEYAWISPEDFAQYPALMPEAAKVIRKSLSLRRSQA